MKKMLAAILALALVLSVGCAYAQDLKDIWQDATGDDVYSWREFVPNTDILGPVADGHQMGNIVEWFFPYDEEIPDNLTLKDIIKLWGGNNDYEEEAVPFFAKLKNMPDQYEVKLLDSEFYIYEENYDKSPEHGLEIEYYLLEFEVDFPSGKEKYEVIAIVTGGAYLLESVEYSVLSGNLDAMGGMHKHGFLRCCQDMLVVNCEEWVTLRAQPYKYADGLAKVPLGAMVHEVYDSREKDYSHCIYNGTEGYILKEYLQEIE